MHSPGHLREAFVEWVEDGGVTDEVGADIFHDGKPRSARWLFGQLWRCSDIMPWDLCADLDMPRGTTYAAAVQHFAAVRSRELEAEARSLTSV